jgi:integrase
VIDDVDVHDIDTAMMVRTLQPIWTTKRETAARVRVRIESILDAEKGARLSRRHLLILTCVRTNEVLLALPEEFDLQRKAWTIPGVRMKTELPLRVRLSAKVIELAREAMKTGHTTASGRPCSGRTTSSRPTGRVN